MKRASRAVTLEALTQAFSDFGRTVGREIRDFTRQEIAASEFRIKRDILTGVAELIDGGVLPQIDDHENRILELEAETRRT